MTTAVVIAAGIVASVVDVWERRIPNVLNLTVAAAGLVMAATGLGSVGLPAALGGAVLGLALMLPGHLVGATGAGDVKLLAAFGTLLGPGGVFRAFLAAAIAGGLMAGAVAIARGRLRQTLEHTAWLVTAPRPAAAAIESPSADNRFPYAPAVALGAAFVALGW